MRRHPQQRFALAECLAHQAELVMLQIAQAAMDQLGGGRGGGAGEIAAFGKDHRQTATGSIAGDAGAVHAATDDKEIGRFRHHQSTVRSEEHTSELQSLMRTSYAVSCLK